MHADREWKAVEGVLTKEMATVGEYLQTRKQKLSTTKMVSTAFHLNNKEPKREMKVNFNNESMPFCSETKCLGVTLEGRSRIADNLSNVSRRWHPASRSWGGLLAPVGCWSNNSANNHPCLGAFNLSTLRVCLVPQCSYTPYRPRHQRRLANCDSMSASYNSGPPSNPRRHPTWWASSQRSHTVSSMPCHGAWRPTPLSPHPSIEFRCTASQIETPIYTRRTTHQFIWQQHTCGALGGSPMECGVGGQPNKNPHFHHRHRQPSGVPPRKSLGPA